MIAVDVCLFVSCFGLVSPPPEGSGALHLQVKARWGSRDFPGSQGGHVQAAFLASLTEGQYLTGIYSIVYTSEMDGKEITAGEGNKQFH